MPKSASSLSRQRTDLIPEIYHRPQESSGLKVELRRKVGHFDTHQEFRRTFENPNVNALDAFKPKYQDNYESVRLYVVNYNHVHRRKRDAEFLGRLRLDYLASFEHFNLCWKCRKPIKTVSVSISHQKTEPRTPDQIKGRVAIPPSLSQTERCGFTLEDVIVADNKRTKRSISSRDGKRKRYDHVEQKYKIAEVNPFKVEFNETHFTPAAKGTTDLYADIKPHFETKESFPGSDKWIYVYIDGTGIEKGVKIVGKNRRLYFELETGKELPKYKSPNTYRVFNVKCNCKVR